MGKDLVTCEDPGDARDGVPGPAGSPPPPATPPAAPPPTAAEWGTGWERRRNGLSEGAAPYQGALAPQRVIQRKVFQHARQLPQKDQAVTGAFQPLQQPRYVSGVVFAERYT